MTADATTTTTYNYDDILNRSRLANNDHSKEMLREFLGEYDKISVKKGDTIEKIRKQVAELDAEIGEKVDAVLHNEQFQNLEASWRGLHYLVMNTETGPRLKLRLMSVKRNTLKNDLGQAADTDQSTLFKKVYEEEYGTYGGNPFSLLLGDFYFDHSPEDMDFLKNIAKVASAAHTPFIAAASHKLFSNEWDSFRDLANPRDLSKIFEGSELAAWRSLRESEDARYVTLTLPRFLLRLPYGDKTIKVDGFGMNEDINVDEPAKKTIWELKPAEDGHAYTQEEIDAKKKEAEAAGEVVYDVKAGWDAKQIQAARDRARERQPKKHRYYLWGNPAYALGQRITNAFAMYGWCAAIRGPEGGGLVRSLPTHTFQTEEGDVAMKCPTELAITDRRENELSNLGFIALCHRKNENYAAFFGAQTIHKPQAYSTDAANANALISARLPYLLAASRFAHYLKVICRDKIGSFQTKETMSLYLNRWIMSYVLGTDDAGQELKAQYPLREARVDIFDVPGKPGAYRAVVFLRPHFQLEELTASIRLVAELPPPAK